ncbi:MAG: hypothetical protein KKH68_12650 [Proteobacteria bacterium]|nr:hypothetical protein [Pseudomonadota bacterium]
MNILFFENNQLNSKKNYLLQAVESAANGKRIETVTNFENLSKRLKRLSYTIAAAVLFASSSETLSGILLLKEFFEDIRVILILPDRMPETISKGHLLRPRFLTYADSDFEEVRAVLTKMLK